MSGIHDMDLANKVFEELGLHPLIGEDILNTNQRTKLEIHDNYIYATFKTVKDHPIKETFIKEQVSLILKNQTVVSFLQGPEDFVDHLRKRILLGKGRIRKLKADYLFYSLVDSIIDSYFVLLDKLQDKLDYIEECLLNNPSMATIINDVHSLKKELLYIRKITVPLREIILYLERDESGQITEGTFIYLRDAYDHCIQVNESVELIRDIVSGLIEFHLSSINNKMNEVMKYLTVFASIFIPLTFITGIYGMNFEFMPELKWRFGYFLILGMLLFFGLALFFFFKKKKWL